MQLAVRLILILFLSALILLNVNSIRILNLSLTLLNQEAKERTALAAQQFASDLTSEHPQESNAVFMKNYFRTKMAQLDCDAIVLANAVGEPKWQVFGNIPEEIKTVVLHPSVRAHSGSLREGRFYVAMSYTHENPPRAAVLLFQESGIEAIERSRKFLSYSNILLIAFGVLLVIYFLETTLRPFRVLMQTARKAPDETKDEESHNDADFLISTFNSVIERLKEKEAELARLHLAEKARADDVQQLNQDLISSISSGLILIDRSHQIRIFNEAAASILKLPAQNVLNRSYEEIISSLSTEFGEDIDRCFSEMVHINRAELEIRTKKSELRYLGANIMPLRDRQENFAGVFCLFTDITEFKVLQQHMALKEKFASLGEMAAGVAHEFRNSLATITGYLQLLEKRAATDQQAYTSSMQKELQLMQKVVNDFLSFARPVHLNVEPVRLHDLIRDCISEVQVTAPPSFRFDVRGTFPTVAGDEMMLRQVFTNLLRNAVESINPSQTNGQVILQGAIAAEGRFVWIDVQDNGTGIKQEDLTRVFTPFFSTKHTGVGLGLAIVQKLILQHNGAISVESNSNGTRFRIQLPLEAALV